MIPITPDMVIKTIGGVQTVVSNAPVLLNAGKFIVQNGIKTGGYQVMSTAWKGIAEGYGGDLAGIAKAAFDGKEGLTGIGKAAFGGLKEQFGGNTQDLMSAGKAVLKSQNSAAKSVAEAGQAAAKTVGSNFSSTLAAAGSAAAKGGLIGIAASETA